MAWYRIAENVLDAIANAINAKTGKTAPMTPVDMVSEIQSIQTDGFNWQDYFNGTIPTGRILLQGNITIAAQFKLKKDIPSCTIYSTATSITAISALRDTGGFVGFVFPYLANITQGYTFCENSKLRYIDLGPNLKQLPNRVFYQNTSMNLLIFRSTDIVALTDTDLANQTPFKQNGEGGTIYIPKVLYDHLGDGTPLDYKATTNWSTIDAFGTITWAQIEGSIYETQYADGTPIQ
jgi:hypothetical protein